jgi:hypothetical protein
VRLPDPQRSRLVLIGTSGYADENLPDLPAARRSLDDLAAALTDPETGVVPAEHCDVLADVTDIRLIGRRLRAAAKAAEDLLLVYFVGHGLTAGRRHELYLALPGTEWEEPEFSALEYDKLRSAVLNSPAANKVIILDCCFSGRAFGEAQSGPGVLPQIEVDGSYVLTSAPRDHVSLVVPGEQHTAFTGRLLGLLRGGLPGAPELLTMDVVYAELRRTMETEGLPEPQCSGSATARLLALARNHAFAATAGPALRGRRAMAMELGEHGDWAAAVAALRETLREQERIFGAQDADSMVTRQCLGHATCAAGDRQDGIAMLRRLLADQTRILGQDHADALQTGSSWRSASASRATGTRRSRSCGCCCCPTGGGCSAATTRAPCAPCTCWPGTWPPRVKPPRRRPCCANC